MSVIISLILFTLTLSVLSDPLFPLFDCPPLENDHIRPDNVNQLRPGDIKAVMALGDSISAGFAMKAEHFYTDLFDDLLEYRGDVFSAGGNPGAITVPNFLKHYNPDLVGAAVGESLPLDAVKWRNHIIEPFDAAVTHLNAGQSMAKIENTPGQIEYLVQQLRTTYAKTVDFEKDWKMLTIFIGANDICPACDHYDGNIVKNGDNFEKWYRQMLDQVYTSIPRVYVNSILLFNISQVHTFAMESYYCRFMWDTFCKGECGCMTHDSTPEQRLKMDEAAMEFNKRMRKVATEWDNKQLTNFTVKIQPYLEQLSIPESMGLNFLSKLDCFHPSAIADAGFAIGLWNNMMSPPSEKEQLDIYNLKYKCPTNSTYLQ